MAYAELPWRPFLGHQTRSWTTLRRGNVFYYVYKRFFLFLFERFFYIYEPHHISAWSLDECWYLWATICSYLDSVHTSLLAPFFSVFALGTPKWSNYGLASSVLCKMDARLTLSDHWKEAKLQYQIVIPRLQCFGAVGWAAGRASGL